MAFVQTDSASMTSSQLPVMICLWEPSIFLYGVGLYHHVILMAMTWFPFTLINGGTERLKIIIAVLHLIIFHVSAEWDNKTSVKYVVVNMASIEARPWNTQYRPCFLQMMWSYWSLSTHTGKVCSWEWGSASVNLRLWSSAWKERSTHSGLGQELLPQVERFKYLGVFFTTEGKMEQKIKRQTACAVMWTLQLSVVLKKELSQKPKISIN